VIANQPAKPKLSARKKAPKQQPAPAVAAETRALDAASSNITASAPGAAGGVVGGVAAAKTMQAAPAPLRDLSREEKIRVFKDRLAHGADPKVIAKEARDAGLNDFADELEKKKP
jgi:hypothetical protein